jgi:outer membrane protein TolC
MRHRNQSAAFGKASLAALLLLGACATDALDRAPPEPSAGWTIAPPPPASPGTTGSLAASLLAGPIGPQPASASRAGDAVVDPNRPYGLAELIDIAQRSNPETRGAWERARQAALAVGLVEAEYLPEISAEALAGYQHVTLPIPPSLVPGAKFTAQSVEFLPALTVKWLLFDFGRRSSAEKAAIAESFTANVGFTGAHQRLIFAVSRDYFGLGAARGRLRAAEEAVRNARVVEDTVRDRNANGLATVVEMAQAARQTAEARFNLARSTGAEHSAYQALVASMGLAPGAVIKVADNSSQALPVAPAGTVDKFVDDAMANRPDVIAALGKVRAAEAKLDLARAAYNPTVALVGQGFQNIGGLSAQGSRYYSINDPGGNIMLQLSWPLFDAGARDAKVGIARSAVAAAHDELDQTRNVTVKQVADAYDAVNTGLAEHEAAVALVAAARTAYDAALDAYRHGVGTYTDLVNDETSLTRAQAELEDAHADALTAAAELAFVTGAITATQPSP